jgi:sec-independent protein translocase protein TatA
VFNAGGGELIVVLVIILLVFGPSQIPKMARGLGQALREFRKAQHEITDEIHGDETKPANPPENKPTG